MSLRLQDDTGYLWHSCIRLCSRPEECMRELSQEFRLATKVTQESFYVDDGLTGANIQKAIQLQEQLQNLFSRASFQLRKWNSSEAQVLNSSSEMQKKYYLYQILALE